MASRGREALGTTRVGMTLPAHKSIGSRTEGIITLKTVRLTGRVNKNGTVAPHLPPETNEGRHRVQHAMTFGGDPKMSNVIIELASMFRIDGAGYDATED